jgi:hypothetical protein
MYVHWREREHEDIDILVEEDPAFTKRQTKNYEHAFYI